MNISHAERRQIENEMIFRRLNEKVGDDSGALDAMHIEDGHPDLIRDEDLELYFKCECSDENCDVRILLLLNEYQQIHADRNTLVVLPDHQVDPIEKVTKMTPEYNIVMKNNSIDKPSDTLNVTNVNNTDTKTRR